jgi:hypothetical protein
MRTRYSWSTVSTMAEPKTRLVSLVAICEIEAVGDARPAFVRARVREQGGGAVVALWL